MWELTLPDQLIYTLPHVDKESDADSHPLYSPELPDNEINTFTERRPLIKSGISPWDQFLWSDHQLIG